MDPNTLFPAVDYTQIELRLLEAVGGLTSCKLENFRRLYGFGGTPMHPSNCTCGNAEEHEHLERAVAQALEVRGARVSLPTRGVRCDYCGAIAVLAVDKAHYCELCFNSAQRGTARFFR